MFKILYTVKFNYFDGWVCTKSEDPDQRSLVMSTLFVITNSEDPDQTAPKEQSDQVYTVCDSICIFMTASFVENLNCSIFRT